MQPANTYYSRYSEIQFIGYEIFTAPQENQNYDYILNKWIFTKDYTGINNNSNDITARVELVQYVLNESYKRADNRQTTLKIFMLPEFFFRGSQGAYNEKDLSNIVNQLSKITIDSKWIGWLFIFGTVVLTSNHPDPNVSYRTILSILQSGGNPNFGKYITKEIKSSVDYIKKTNLLPSSTKISDDRIQHYSGNNDIIFDVPKINLPTNRKIKFGLEICLDHSRQRLCNEVSKQKTTPVDIQLITSCGMQVETTSICVINGGYIFLCDGAGFGIQIFRKDEMGNLNILLNTSQHTKYLLNKACLLEAFKILKHTKTNPDLFARDYGQVHISQPLPLGTVSQVLDPATTQLKLVRTYSLLPLSSSGFTLTMSNEPILLNGMKVLFDNPTPTTPVTLQPKQRGTNNGR